jgi:hypothetical protein
VNPIQGKVAAIVSEREIAINVGRKHGVKVGMQFTVLSSKDAEIKDPDTGETIGVLDREIARVQAIDVQELMTVCAESIVAGPRTLEDALAALLEPRVASRRLGAGPARGTLPALNPPDQYVRIGDRVRQIDEG